MKAFFRCAQEWRHLKRLKRAGHGQELSGVRGTKPGDLCVCCVACPRPGYNIPEDWDKIESGLR